MPTNYTGVYNATQAPASAPAVNTAPICSLPVDADALSAATVYQMVKVLADNVAFLQNVVGGTLTGKSLSVDGTGGAAGTPAAGQVAALTGLFQTNTSGTVANAGGGTGVLGKDSVPWAWGRISVSAGVSCTLVRGNNLGAPNYVATGQYDVVLSHAVSSTAQAVVLVSVTGNAARCVSYVWQTTTSVRVFVFDAAGVAAEVTDFSVIVYST